MRLINTQTLELEEFYGRYPKYAILSHTWTDEEATFQDWQWDLETLRKKKRGFVKITSACKRALHDGHKYLWCDTICIDKTSSAELSEAINSMFSWYKGSAVCYAYLEDVVSIPRQETQLLNSRWFTRGWTLQELLAPRSVIFFSRNWASIGTRRALSREISTTTGINEKVIQGGSSNLYNASISERMSWVSHRETTRVEDLAYCMLGIFDINMPLLYGEGNKAFIRLQEEIIRVYNDQTIFCWHWDTQHVPEDWASILAPSPRTFRSGADYSPSFRFPVWETYSMTNAGLHIGLPVLDSNWGVGRILAFLNVVSKEAGQEVGLLLNTTRTENHCMRCPALPRPIPIRKDLRAATRGLYLAGPRERFLHSPVEVPRAAALVTVNTWDTGFETLQTHPRPRFGFPTLHQLDTEKRYGASVGLWAVQPSPDAYLRHVGTHNVNRRSLQVIIFFGFQIDHIHGTPSLRIQCKVLSVKEAEATLWDFQNNLDRMEERLQSDIQFSRSIFPSDGYNDSHSLDSEEYGISVLVSLNTTIGGLEGSILIIAHIQFRELKVKLYSPSALNMRLAEVSSKLGNQALPTSTTK